MKMALAVSTVFHIEHLKRVYRQWEDAEFLLFAAIESTGNKEMIVHLKRMGARFRHVSEFLRDGGKADVMVSVFWQPAFLVMGPRTMHVRIMYGYAKDDWNYGDWNRNYDLILAYGPYAEERLRHLAPCISVGHPRTPAPGQGNTKGSGRLQTNRRRPILLYCPTYGAQSSLPDVDRVLSGLAVRFDVAVKLHHLSQAEHYPCLSRLARESRIRVYDQRTDLFDLLPDCDLVISDHSGAIFDAMLLGKNILLIDSEAMKGRIREEMHSDSSSLDIKVRRVLPHCEVADLVSAVGEALHHPVQYQSLLPYLYANVGTDVPNGIRAAITDWFHPFPERNRQAELYERLVRFMEKDDRELLICGAGEFGQAVMQLAKARGCGRIRFVDSDPDKLARSVEGIPVLPPGGLDDLDKSGTKCLVATIGGAGFYAQRLKRAGFVPDEDYFMAF